MKNRDAGGNGRQRHNAIIREYGMMMMKNPRSFVFVSMADTCIRAGRAKMALEVLNKGLRHHPMLVPAHVQKGRALVALGRYAEAKQSLSWALENDADNVLARKLLAQACMETGDPARGMKLLDEVRALWPKHEPARRLYEELKAAIEKTHKDDDYREERDTPDARHAEALDTLGRWLENVNKMMVKG